MMNRIIFVVLLAVSPLLAVADADLIDLTEDVFEEVERADSPRACYTLGLMYLQGEGIAEDKKLALSWLKKSADQGYYLAMHRLGKLYLSGEVTKSDPAVALKHITMSAGNGYSPSQYLLGTLYQTGKQGVDKNPKEALRWFKLAADQGHKRAKQVVAQLSSTDTGGASTGASGTSTGSVQATFDRGFKLLKRKDYKEAAQLFGKAAEQGNADAQYNLGELYNKGRGVKRNKKTAQKWYEAAAEQGHVKAKYRTKGCGFC